MDKCWVGSRGDLTCRGAGYAAAGWGKGKGAAGLLNNGLGGWQAGGLSHPQQR